jgi:hypothetical protein
MLLFANNQVIISNTEDNLQKAVYKLNQIIIINNNNGLIICAQKKKTDGI